VFDSLSNIDLPRRMDAVAPRPLTRLVVAGALLSVVGLVRLAVDAVAPGVTPFALLYPAVLLATLLAGWMSGATVMGVGGLLVWWVVLQPPHRSFALGNPAEAVSLALYFVSTSAIIGFAEAFRVNAPRLVIGQAALKESEARLELAVAAARLGVWEWRRATGQMILSAEARAICGFPEAGPVTAEMVAAITHRGDLAKTREQTRRALDPDKRDDVTYEYRLITPAGEQRQVALNGRAVFETENGVTRATRYIGTLQDITARRAAEAERGESSTRLRLAVEAGRMAVWQLDARGIVSSPELNRVLGVPDDARMTLEDLYGLYLPGERERVSQIAKASLARGERYIEAEFRIRRPDGELRWLLIRAEVQGSDKGGTRSLVGVIMDVTERKDSEERLKLLAREVDHRANNLLAVVQGTVQLSQAATAEELKTVLIGRVAALGRAHQLLSEARWEGADLRRLVEEELLAFSLGEAARVSIRGADVALPPPAAQALAMALHELATNAAKYGALSTPEGQVAVSWTRERRGALTIRWAETGGPAVARPTRKGLGAVMLERALGGPLRGETRMDWRAEGLVCELELPGEVVEPAAVG